MKDVVLVMLFSAMSIIGAAQNDTVSIRLRHDAHEAPLCVLDGLRLPGKLFMQLALAKGQIKHTKALDTLQARKKYGEDGQNGAIEITSKILIVLNDKIPGHKSKVDLLSTIEPSAILEMRQANDEKQIDKFGRLAKFGVLYIKTRPAEQAGEIK